MMDDKRELNNGEEPLASDFVSPGNSESAGHISFGADDSISRGSEAQSGIGQAIAPEIVPEHLDELPDIENVEDYVGEDHVYDEETAGALVALMFAKRQREEGDDEDPSEHRDARDQRSREAPTPSFRWNSHDVEAPSPKEHSPKLFLWAIVAIFLIFCVVAILAINDVFGPDGIFAFNGTSPSGGTSASDSVDLLSYDEFNGEVYITKCSSSAVEVIIPDEINGMPVVEIGNYAFSDCALLENIVIPDSVTIIASYAFQNCTSLTSVVLPDSVTRIGNSAFYGCDGLTSIVIPDGVKIIGNYAFEGCASLTNVIIGSNVESIGNYAFANCDRITSITIPERVTTVGDYAFYGCASLRSIIIPDNVVFIGLGTFGSCDILTIYCEAESKPDGWNVNWNSSNRPVAWAAAPKS